MMKEAIKQDSESVFMDILTYQDLEMLKARNSSSSSASFQSNTSSNPALAKKRYMILTYHGEFDRVHYPLPLQHIESPSDDQMRKTIERLTSDIESFRSSNGFSMMSQSDAFRNTTQSQFAYVDEENQLLRDKIGALEKTFSHFEFQQLCDEKVELETQYSSLRRETEQQMSSHKQKIKKIEFEISELHGELDKLRITGNSFTDISDCEMISRQLEDLKADLEHEKTVNGETVKNQEQDLEANLTDLKEYKNVEGKLKTRIRELESELDIANKKLEILQRGPQQKRATPTRTPNRYVSPQQRASQNRNNSNGSAQRRAGSNGPTPSYARGIGNKPRVGATTGTGVTGTTPPRRAPLYNSNTRGRPGVGSNNNSANRLNGSGNRFGSGPRQVGNSGTRFGSGPRVGVGQNPRVGAGSNPRVGVGSNPRVAGNSGPRVNSNTRQPIGTNPTAPRNTNYSPSSRLTQGIGQNRARGQAANNPSPGNRYVSPGTRVSPNPRNVAAQRVNNFNRNQQNRVPGNSNSQNRNISGARNDSQNRVPAAQPAKPQGPSVHDRLYGRQTQPRREYNPVKQGNSPAAVRNQGSNQKVNKENENINKLIEMEERKEAKGSEGGIPNNYVGKVNTQELAQRVKSDLEAMDTSEIDSKLNKLQDLLKIAKQ